MAFRLSSAQIHNTGLNGLLDIQRNVTRTQEQIATNKRVLTPGDDPVAATRIMALNQELRLNDQYNSNLDTLQNRLEREDVALTGVGDLLQRAQELVTQAGSTALNDEQKGYLAVELQSVIDSMAQTMNSRDANGEYLFAGSQGKTEPFVVGADGRYEYRGDEGQRSIRIGSTTSVAATDPGYKVFMDVASSVNTLQARANPNNNGSAQVSSSKVTDHAAFDKFYPEDVIIEFQPLDDVAPPRLTYNVRQVSDGRVFARNEDYISGEQIEFGGAAVTVSGNPSAGDTFIVESTDKKSLLGNLEDFVTNLRDLPEGADSAEQFSDQLGNTLANLNNAQTNLLETQSSIGARLNVIDSSREANADLELAIEAARSDLEDLDYAEAISRLQQETFVLEAAQASFARVGRLSLFNYL